MRCQGESVLWDLSVSVDAVAEKLIYINGGK